MVATKGKGKGMIFVVYNAIGDKLMTTKDKVKAVSFARRKATCPIPKHSTGIPEESYSVVSESFGVSVDVVAEFQRN